MEQDANTEIESDKKIEIESEKEREKKITTPPDIYGEFKNIRLTDDEYQRLKDKLQGHAELMIDKLSRCIESKGVRYNNHYATILNWYEQDKEKLSKRGETKSYAKEDYEKGE